MSVILFFHTLKKGLGGDGPIEFVGVGSDEIEAVERNVEVVVHEFSIEKLVELLRSTELADGETDGTLLTVA